MELGRERDPPKQLVNLTLASVLRLIDSSPHPPHNFILKSKTEAALYPHTMWGTFGILHYGNCIHQTSETEEPRRGFYFILL